MTVALRILLALLVAWFPFAASAAVVQITVKDTGGNIRTFNVTTNTDITGNLDWNNVICDQAAGTTCASVGTAGSPSTNALTVQAVTLGHGTAANAMRVELPTDGTGQVVATQGTAANLNATVVGTGTFATQLTGATNNINNIAGTISLPTGAATSALQTTGNTALTTINTTLGTPMQMTGGSVTANAGTNLNTSALGTSANQATIITGIAGLNTLLTTLNATALTPVPFPINLTGTSCAGTATGTAANALASSATRHGGWISNISGDVLWISWTGTATVGGANNSTPLPPMGSSGVVAGGSFTYPAGAGLNNALSVVSAGTSSPYTCTQY